MRKETEFLMVVELVDLTDVPPPRRVVHQIKVMATNEEVESFKQKFEVAFATDAVDGCSSCYVLRVTDLSKVDHWSVEQMRQWIQHGPCWEDDED